MTPPFLSKNDLTKERPPPCGRKSHGGPERPGRPPRVDFRKFQTALGYPRAPRDAQRQREKSSPKCQDSLPLRRGCICEYLKLRT